MNAPAPIPTRVYLEIRGGFLAAAYSDALNLELRVLDWDEVAVDETTTPFLMPIDPTAEMFDETRLQFFGHTASATDQ